MIFLHRLWRKLKAIWNWFRMCHFYFHHVKLNKFNTKQFFSLLPFENPFTLSIYSMQWITSWCASLSKCCGHFGIPHWIDTFPWGMCDWLCLWVCISVIEKHFTTVIACFWLFTVRKFIALTWFRFVFDWGVTKKVLPDC